MSPPVDCESPADASITPLLIVLPPEPTRRITPPVLSMRCARMIPSLLTTFVKTSFAVLAANSTLPPPALISPLLSTAASSTPVFSSTSPVTSKNNKPSPSKSRDALLPAARVTWPSSARISPSLLTALPINVTEPPVDACSRPRFTTTPGVPSASVSKL